MNWTMPRPVLKVVAALLGVACLGAFTLGVVTAPSRGRLPGEKLDGVTGQPIQAVEAKPLTDERIQGAAPAVELTEEQKAALEEEKKARAEAASLAKAEAEKGGAVTAVAPTSTPTPAPVAEAAAPAPPPPPKTEEPPF